MINESGSGSSGGRSVRSEPIDQAVMVRCQRLCALSARPEKNTSQDQIIYDE